MSSKTISPGDVACPRCDAEPGSACRGPEGLPTFWHLAREGAARRAEPSPERPAADRGPAWSPPAEVKRAPESAPPLDAELVAAARKKLPAPRKVPPPKLAPPGAVSVTLNPAAAVSKTGPNRLDDEGALARECPTCGARPDERCRTEVLSGRYHADRHKVPGQVKRKTGPKPRNQTLEA